MRGCIAMSYIELEEKGQGMMIGVVFLDLRRAFELVYRNILLKKLEWYGIKRVILSWFKSYLENNAKIKFNENVIRSYCREAESSRRIGTEAAIVFVLYK